MNTGSNITKDLPIESILLLDRGWSANQIAEALFIDENTVRRYKKSYEAGGLEELIDDGYKGGLTKLSSIQEEELARHLQENIYLTTKEIINHVKSEYGIKFSSSGMKDLLHRLGFSLIRSQRLFPAKRTVKPRWPS